MKIKLLDYKHIPGFDGGASVDFHEGNVYLTNLNFTEVVILSPKWKEIDRIPLFVENTMPASPIRSEVHAATLVQINEIPRLLALRAVTGRQHQATLINLDDLTREEHEIDLSDTAMNVAGIKKPSITAAAIVLGKLVLGNRSTELTKENNFVVTDVELWRSPESRELSLLPIKYPETAPTGLVLSGMCYSPANDWLLLSFTPGSEGTDNEQQSASYIALVENASRKVARKQIKINELVKLSSVNKVFDRFQVKAMCIQTDKPGKSKLFLVSDHPGGGTQIFNIRIKH